MDLHIVNNISSRRPDMCQLPQSSVLSRLKSFLPQIAAANVRLDEQLQQSPSACDIENIQDCDGPIIEMNIAVVEHEDDNTSLSSSSDGDSDASDDEEDKTNNEDDSQKQLPSTPCNLQSTTLPKLKLPKAPCKVHDKPAKPHIEVLSSSNGAQTDKVIDDDSVYAV